MGLFAARSSADQRRAVEAAWGEIVRQARAPVFYGAFAVADTPDGRFDLIALHAALVMRRLRGEGERAAAFAQAVFDRMFADFDESLREMGVGDLSVGRYVKGLAKSFYGRLAAYGDALDAADGAALRAALARNLYRGAPPGEAALALVARYVKRSAAGLAAAPVASILEGSFRFGDPPAPPEDAGTDLG